MRRLALTTWSLHHNLGSPPMAGPDLDGHAMSSVQEPPPALTLLELPNSMQELGIGTLEICHFHLPTTAPDYLRELRAVIAAAGVELFSILIDRGDITAQDPQRRAADLRLIEGWIDVASALGARAVRVIAGDAPPTDEAALELSIAGLRHLAGYGHERGVRVLTENFRPLASTAANCNRILDALDGAVGLCADIGNFPAVTRVAEFSAVIGRAESVHAKASYSDDGRIEPGQLRQCLDASIAAGYSGPYTLVYDKPGDEWKGIIELKGVVGQYLS